MAPQATKGNPVPLIIFIVLFVFSTVGFALAVVEWANLKEQMNAGFNRQDPAGRIIDERQGLKLALQEAEAKILRKQEALNLYKKITGIDDIGDIVVDEDGAKRMVDGTKRMDNLRDEINETIGGGGQATAANASTLVGLLKVIEKKKLLLDAGIREMKLAHAQEVKRLGTRLKGEVAAVTEKQTAIDERDAQIETLKAELATDRNNARLEATALRTALQKTRANMADMRTELMERIRILEAENIDLRAQIVVLHSEKGGVKGKPVLFSMSSEAADGKVILVDSEAGVIVDIGRKKGVRRGLRFEVYLQKGDGSRAKRGEIEIKTVFPEISRAILVGGGDPADLIFKNDIIINPAFEPGRAKRFVADTTFDVAKKEAFRRALSEYGSILEQDITLRTDYLIVGMRKGKLVDKAEKRGIVIIREDELNAFLGR